MDYMDFIVCYPPDKNLMNLEIWFSFNIDIYRKLVSKNV